MNGDGRQRPSGCLLFVGGPAWSLRWTEARRGEEMAPAAERLRSSGRVLRRALLVVSDGVSYGLAPRPRGGVAAVDAPLSLAKASGMGTGELGVGSW